MLLAVGAKCGASSLSAVNVRDGGWLEAAPKTDSQQVTHYRAGRRMAAARASDRGSAPTGAWEWLQGGVRLAREGRFALGSERIRRTSVAPLISL
jgi:hypothetical protein